MNVKCARIFFLVVSVSFCLLPLQRLYAISVQDSGDHNAVDDGTAVKKVLDLRYAGENLLDPNAWRPWHKGMDFRFSISNWQSSMNEQGFPQRCRPGNG